MPRYRTRTRYVIAIQWTGQNLKDVIALVGKHPKWDSWFSSWEEYEEKVLHEGLKIGMACFAGGLILIPIGHYVGRNEEGDIDFWPFDSFEDKYEMI